MPDERQESAMDLNAFHNLPVSSANHFRLYFYAAVLRTIVYLLRQKGSFDAVMQEFPFLAGYINELSESGLEGLSLEEAQATWCRWMEEWEGCATDGLPLAVLRCAEGLDVQTMTLMLWLGLVDEDPRFGAVIEAAHHERGCSKPSEWLAQAVWADSPSPVNIRALLRRWYGIGLVRTVPADGSYRLESLSIPHVIWETVRGEFDPHLVPWARYRPPAELCDLGALILPDEILRSLERVPSLVQAGQVRTVVVKGPRRNSRRTCLEAIAKACGCGVIEVMGSLPREHEQWTLLGPLALLLRAVPVVVADNMPGESAVVPKFPGYEGLRGLILAQTGGLGGGEMEGLLTVTLSLPSEAERRRHWEQAFGQHRVENIDRVSERFRLTSGAIRRAAQMAPSLAAFALRAAVEIGDVREATRLLSREALDTLATRIDLRGDWDAIAVSERTREELTFLEHRCRHRERLHRQGGVGMAAQASCGVRALFSGPSGTGKTLAAQLLAAALDKDLYRIDLASIVNKFLGETEKRLSQLFAASEELDVVLLLDEGDSLLTQRTSVQSSNDRYANLETNYLLQRMESFEGILLVTTNASDRIDQAFQRRMDVVVEFRQPDVVERLEIWRLHLPESHCIDPLLLHNVAMRCVLSGGQIRNAVMHASLLALSQGMSIASHHVEAAVQREYRKMGCVCPLRDSVAVPVNGV
jgi:hypothetical protein